MYSGLAHDELSTLQTCVLLDEFEQPLKSKLDYLASLQHVFELFPEFHAYCKTFLVPFPADWPGWYYTKKLIAQGHNISNIIPEQGPFHVCLNAQEDTIQILNFSLTSFIYSFLTKNCPNDPKSSVSLFVLLQPFWDGLWCESML